MTFKPKPVGVLILGYTYYFVNFNLSTCKRVLKILDVLHAQQTFRGYVYVWFIQPAKGWLFLHYNLKLIRIFKLSY